MMQDPDSLWRQSLPPEPPMEASGTSGMKAALIGVPNLSVLDGWWIEEHIEGLTGWSIGTATRGKGENRNHSLDAPSLYDKLAHAIVPLFYHDRRSFMDIMAYSIAIRVFFQHPEDGAGICAERLFHPLKRWDSKRYGVLFYQKTGACPHWAKSLDFR